MLNLIKKYLSGNTNPIEDEKVMDLLIEEDAEARLFLEVFWISGPEVKLLDKEKSSKLENNIFNRIQSTESTVPISVDSCYEIE